MTAPRKHGWIIHIAPWHIWKMMISTKPSWINEKRVGIFRNLPHVIPGRWGFFVLGFEFGSRNPGNRFGSWLKRIGVWSW